MKKTVQKTIALVMVMVFMILLCSCGNHKHSFGEWTIEKPATCTEKGTRTRACECGEKETEEIPALGHNFVNGTCTECGTTEK